jgi:hypothetical protein
MGVVEFFQRVFSADSSAGISHLPVLDGEYSFDVVGESHYGQSFRALSKVLHKKSGEEVLLELELRVNPSNRYSPSGKAVAVYCLNRQIGHLPEEAAPQFFDKLMERGGKARARGRIWFDDRSYDFSRCSASIKTDFPPRFLGETRELGYKLSHSYYLKYSKETQKKIDLGFEERVSQGPRSHPPIEELRRVFLSTVSISDRNLLDLALKRAGIGIDEIKTKRESAQLMIIGDGQMGESIYTSRAILNSIEILTVSEFFQLYPSLGPAPDVLESRERFLTWQSSSSHLHALNQNEPSQVLQVMTNGRLRLPGNFYSGEADIQRGMYSDDKSSRTSFREQQRKLLIESECLPHDSLLLSCTLGPSIDTSRYAIEFQGLVIGYSSEEAKGILDLVEIGEPILVQLNWISSEKVSFSMELVRAREIVSSFYNNLGQVLQVIEDAARKSGK